MARLIQEGHSYRSVSGKAFGPMKFYMRHPTLGKIFIVEYGDGQVWQANGKYGFLHKGPNKRDYPKDLILREGPVDLSKYE